MTLSQGLRLLGGLSLLTLTACGTTPATETSSACLIFEPITYSLSNDTPETVDQIVRHNAAWDSLCQVPE